MMPYVVEELEDEVDVHGLEPLLYDRAKWVGWAVAERERFRRAEEEKERKKAESRRRREAHDKVMDSIMEFDPKAGRKVYTRFFLRDFSVFDIDEESPVPAMRCTDNKYEDKFNLQDSANILSVKVAASDVGFPIDIYGTIIARDSIDYKCIPIFRRGRDDPQRIDSEDTSLTLTGPGRGLVLVDFIYLEVDLNIKDEQGAHMDRRLSKGFESIDGRVIIRAQNDEEKTRFTSTTIDSWLSTVEIEYTVVQGAVEATVEFNVLGAGNFRGKITASTTGFDDVKIVLHDSGAASGGVWCARAVNADDGIGIVALLRRVMVVHLDEMLVLQVEDDQGVATAIDFVPSCYGNVRREIACSAVRLEVKVTWSFMDYRAY